MDNFQELSGLSKMKKMPEEKKKIAKEDLPEGIDIKMYTGSSGVIYGLFSYCKLLRKEQKFDELKVAE
jgi:alpha-glucuronidase